MADHQQDDTQSAGSQTPNHIGCKHFRFLLKLGKRGLFILASLVHLNIMRLISLLRLLQFRLLHHDANTGIIITDAVQNVPFHDFQYKLRVQLSFQIQVLVDHQWHVHLRRLLGEDRPQATILFSSQIHKRLVHFRIVVTVPQDFQHRQSPFFHSRHPAVWKANICRLRTLESAWVRRHGHDFMTFW